MVTPAAETPGPRARPVGVDLTPGLRPLAFLFRVVRGRMAVASALLCLLAAGAQSLDTLTTVALRRLVNAISNYAPGAGTAPRPVIAAAALFIGCAAGALALSAVFLRIDIGVRSRLLSAIERSLFAYTLWHASRYFEQRLPGQIAQQIRSAADGCSALFQNVAYYGMRFLSMIVSAALVFSASIPALNFLTLAWAVGFLGGSYYITKTCAALSKDASAKSSRVTGRMVDSLRNVSIVRSFARHSFERSYLGRYIDEERTTQTALRLQFYRLFVFQLSCKTILNALVIGCSLYALFEGRTDVGTVIMLITLAGLISALLQEISSRMYEVFDNYGTVSQALAYLLIPQAIRDAPEAVALSPGDGSIGFDNVTFRYSVDGFAIEGLNLFVGRREKVGIVGLSGSGKSTIFRLLKREYEPEAGRVLIGGKDIRRCTLASLREAIGEVPQPVRLFNRSIRENIAYGRPDAPDAEIWRAAEAAYCLDFVGLRRAGMEAEVGEDGAQLSGGERQRISIARAVLKDAPILLLDEPTSGLDPIGEAWVQRSLARLMEGKTVLAIAHRLSTLRQMDRIVVVAGGRIVEDGTHAELLRSGSHYRRLWEDDPAAPGTAGEAAERS